MKVLILLFIIISFACLAQSPFVQSKNGKLYFQSKEYKFNGTNYWYGGFLAHDLQNKGKERLKSELDFLKKKGITNLRVLLSSEGDSSYPYRISPSIQPKPLVYNEALLKSFDYFIAEASKLNMKIVFVLNNNWEWSGGFGQYLDWAGYPNPILPKTSNWDWDNYCGYISQFYTCNNCNLWFQKFINKIVLRHNSINHKVYRDDPTIMTWELANEPRPMLKTEKFAYKEWIKSTSDYIKSLDKNHLITVGVEGVIGTAMDTGLFVDIHKLKSIDYATIHIWPKTWRWYNGETSHSTTDTTLKRTKNYIELHAKLCKEINIPLVIEEFGLHRDENSFEEKAYTIHRDKYFKYIYQIGRENNIAGYNFWGVLAFKDSKLTSDFWHYGLPYSADPPQEEQGLYGVFKSDSSTWKVIENGLKK